MRIELIFHGYQPCTLTFVLCLNKWWRIRGSNPLLLLARQIFYPSELIPHMAGKMGLEPTTLRLTAECSTIELHSNIKVYFLEKHTKTWFR